jgi:heat shock protein HslJ
LKDTEWVLSSLKGEDLLEGAHITLEFQEGWIGGIAGCNAYGGGPDSGGYVATDDGTLTIPEIAITAMECLSPAGIMELERDYVDVLTSASAYRLTGDRLELQNATGETILVYARQERVEMNPGELVGSAWQLVSMDGREPEEDSAITLFFQDGQRISGHAGCRDYVMVYDASERGLSFFYTAMLGAVCSDQTLQEQEGRFSTLLGSTDHYRLSEGQLELVSARGERLLFEPLSDEAVASLEGPTWSLLAFVEPNPIEEMPASLPIPAEPVSGTEITATFADGTLRGSAGCNSYQAVYGVDGAALAVGSIAFTEMACLDPEGVMEQEGRFLEVLQDVVAAEVYGQQLWLETGDGWALVFRAAVGD